MATSFDQHQYVQSFGRTIGNSLVYLEYDLTEAQSLMDFIKLDFQQALTQANLAKDRGQITDFPSPATTDDMDVDGDPEPGETLPVTETAPVNY